MADCVIFFSRAANQGEEDRAASSKVTPRQQLHGPENLKLPWFGCVFPEYCDCSSHDCFG
jgi:hypothetical protein